MNVPSTSNQTSQLKAFTSVSVLLPNYRNSSLQKVVTSCDYVMQYEDKHNQSLALNCIPLEKLHESVRIAIRGIQKDYVEKKVESEQIDYQELMLTALLQWFKDDFFKWVDKPPCPTCKTSSVSSVGRETSTSPYSQFVEMYICDRCNARIPFPRYNDVRDLLRTRRGRCGEWANCFTFFCRVMGWDARLVVDHITDHVWTEVYLNLPGRWVHCDSCEGVVDRPLMYETGWNKKLSYVIAYSCEELQDVTWRYSSNHSEVMKRRIEFDENDLINLILSVREIRGHLLTPLRRQFVVNRSLSELVELMLERKPLPSEAQGRSSGSLMWRRNRGEVATGYVWRVSSTDIENGVWKLGYSPAKNEYVVGQTTTVEWSSGVFKFINMQRKVEHDWKKVYLARCDGEIAGTIQWKVELEVGKFLNKVELRCDSAVFTSGKVSVLLQSDDIQVPLETGVHEIRTDAFSGKQRLSVTVVLTGGEGDVAWQHAQLFRQSIDEENQLPFSLILNIRSGRTCGSVKK